MTDGEHTEPTNDERDAATEPEQESTQHGGGRNEIIDTVLGLAVLGLGAAVVSGSMGVGGLLRGLTRGTPPRTPPIKPM
ncbi:MAG: hypothetical protein JF587_03825 [Catenulisporales bacterium]|nr:hypothetical protein [Catenulisporales bacterium]